LGLREIMADDEPTETLSDLVKYYATIAPTVNMKTDKDSLQKAIDELQNPDMVSQRPQIQASPPPTPPRKQQQQFTPPKQSPQRSPNAKFSPPRYTASSPSVRLDTSKAASPQQQPATRANSVDIGEDLPSEFLERANTPEARYYASPKPDIVNFTRNSPTPSLRNRPIITVQKQPSRGDGSSLLNKPFTSPRKISVVGSETAAAAAAAAAQAARASNTTPNAKTKEARFVFEQETAAATEEAATIYAAKAAAAAAAAAAASVPLPSTPKPLPLPSKFNDALNFLRRAKILNEPEKEQQSEDSGAKTAFEKFLFEYNKEQERERPTHKVTRAEFTRGDGSESRQTIQDDDSYDRKIFARQYWLAELNKIKKKKIATLSKENWSIADSASVMRNEAQQIYSTLNNERRLKRWKQWILTWGSIIKFLNGVLRINLPSLDIYDLKMQELVNNPETEFYLEDVSERLDSKLPSSPEWHLLTAILSPLLLAVVIKLISLVSPVENLEDFLSMSVELGSSAVGVYKDANPSKAGKETDNNGLGSSEEEVGNGGEPASGGILSMLSKSMEGLMRSQMMSGGAAANVAASATTGNPSAESDNRISNAISGGGVLKAFNLDEDA
jgi:hypothetical protein